MKLRLSFILLALLMVSITKAQEVSYEEYDLDNGLHVILHQDRTTPIVVTSISYHVGAKDENPERTGFAHFFEHLLFEGTENIGRGEWDKIVSSKGGKNNATTNDDRTYYYEVFPSNALETGLWLESERLLHPVIEQIGVDTQNEVVKEEKRARVDNQPYGNFLTEIKKNLFKEHPYRWSTIGSMEHLDAATLEEFKAFNEKFYIPNNAVLIIAGDIETAKTKKMIQDYFGPIPKGTKIQKSFPKEEPITQEFKAVAYDANIQIPAVVACYRTPSFKTRDARILDMISTYLSDGNSSKLYKKLVDNKKMSLAVQALNLSQEDYGIYAIYALPLGETSLDSLVAEIDEEIIKLQNELISENDHQKLLNQFENQFVNSNATLEGVAASLATYYQLYGDTNLINTEIDLYRSITREEIMAVAKKYLNKNQRLLLEYLPENQKESK
ncbi:M16 family metallopeptidase [Maribacter sp. HTCC2170]|uniref:M16 family metallopeptidase n=1 Tax=Maribacter sp. (strain HTCC2170 / KCCM 42371) TaxID=313603 RepID=UPI00006B3AFB|nr:pitrilysin family protein [Maribacter sp. HTCC2170]EAQ99785.1 putative zinc protease [Maribacter sp. HTCC2170]